MKVVYTMLLCAVMLTAGQIVWKLGLNRFGAFEMNAAFVRGGLLRLVASPYIVAGLVIYLAATVLWLSVLSRVPLSLAYPLMSISYVLGVVAGWLIFRESVPFTRWLGTFVICAGIVLLSRK
jgi:multidrug transporter EmrE-like cation transporter